MLSLEEYIKKSEELFSYIGGYAENDSIAESCKQEYSRLLLNVTLEKTPEQSMRMGEGPVTVGELIRSDYKRFMVLKNEVAGVFRSKLARLETRNAIKINTPLGEEISVSSEVELRELISKLALYKSGKYVVITQQDRTAHLVKLINEVFYDTSPIYAIRFTFDDNKEDINLSYWSSHPSTETKTISAHTSNSQKIEQKENIDSKLGVKVTGWDTLD